jgi:hypothetical protein
MEAFNAFAVHLHFGFIENLIRFVSPVHAVTKTYYYYLEEISESYYNLNGVNQGLRVQVVGGRRYRP